MLRRRSVRLRIVVLVLVPVIALIGLYGLLLSLSVSSLISLRNAETVRGDVASPVTNVQLQLSREREVALEYLAKPTRYWLGQLLSQESRSDSAIGAYDNVTVAVLARGTAGERLAVKAWSAQLGTLRELRGTVVADAVSRVGAANSYSKIVNSGNNVINQALLPLLATPGVIQASDVLVLEQSLEAEGEESSLFLADLTAHSYPGADQQLITALIVQRKDLWNQGIAGLAPAYGKYFTADIPASATARMTAMENRIETGPRTALQISPDAWNSATHAYNEGFVTALRNAAGALRDTAAGQARGLVIRLVLIAVLGLLAIIAAITVAVIISRTLLRELNDLRISAIALSSQRLPAVLGRLRAGAEVDVERETPQLETEDNEIGELRRAINYTARTAIGAAVDEVAIRRGVNDMFKNLARRNQSLLTRQLELLDAMERRVHDPEELGDLFKVDHLTTRMRRHAEGLLIVAGGSSGRVWREPVPVIDVMRAAVAEVEDYTRIRVSSRSNASVAGHAVADIIHLLAELVENATTFSPANTPVRIESDNVAKGLIVEIEDRGLGMSDEQVARINVRLNDPPSFDLSGSEQLGLYIAGQLARRHNVKITMRSSAYGGVIAVVLIPSALIIDAGFDEPPTLAGIRELGGRPVPQLPAATTHVHGDTALPDFPAAMAGAGYAASTDYAAGTGYLVNLEAAATAMTAPAGSGTGQVGPLKPFSSAGEVAAPDGADGWPAIDDTLAEHAGIAEQRPEPVPALLNLSVQPNDQAESSEPEQPVVESVASRWPDYMPISPASVPASTTGWLNLPGYQPETAAGEKPAGLGDSPDDEVLGLPKRQPSLPVREPDSDDLALTGFEGLPVRVRQANLAAQLRQVDDHHDERHDDRSARARHFVPAPDMAAEPAAHASGDEPGSSPEAARNLMSALQRGWERGRSAAEHLPDELDGEQS